MASKNVETHRAAHNAWNKRDFDAVIGQMTPSITYIDRPRGQTIKSRDEFSEWAQEWAQMFSDGRIVEAQYTEAGDTSVARFTARGTNDGQFGPYSATGKQVTFDICEILDFDSQGRIVGGDVYYDQLTLLVQLGHVKVPAAVGA